MKKLKVNIYNLLKECVENGIIGGWNKAHKHTNTPNKEQVKEQILNYIMLEISEKFKFD
jgi:pyruvate-formate lyase